jgi:exopolysaccharide biosynthesis protein
MNLNFFKRKQLQKISIFTTLFLIFTLWVPLTLVAESDVNGVAIPKTTVENISSATDQIESKPLTPTPDIQEDPKPLAPTPVTQVEVKDLAEGIKYYSMYKVLNDGGMTKINYVKVDTSRPQVEIRPALAGGKSGVLQTLTSISKPYGALAAVNGNFYYMGGQQSAIDTTIIDSQLMVQSPRSATSLVFTADRGVYIDQFLPSTTIRIPAKKLIFQADGVNRPVDNGLVIFNKLYSKEITNNGDGCIELVLRKDNQGNYLVAEVVQGSATIPTNGMVVSFHGKSKDYAEYFAVGDKVILDVDLDDKDILHSLANGPLLVTKGCKTLPIRKEGLETALWSRHPRSAVGINTKGEVLLVVVDGRQEGSVGMTFDELADLMLELGAVDAMAMDGGGSAEMVVEGQIVNSPADGRERGINIGIVVISQIPIYIDGKRLYFELSEVAPLIEKGRILVPVRKIFEQWGAEVAWDDKTRTITATKGKNSIEMKIGSTSAKVNGKSVKLDVPPRIEDGRTVVPLRFVSQAFGGKVEWNATTGSAYIITN